MSYLLSGLNIKNISEYNSSDAYNKYDVIDFQLHSQKSAYPNYTGFGETGLLFWFNNEYLNSFNLDLDNYKVDSGDDSGDVADKDSEDETRCLPNCRCINCEVEKNE